MSKQIILMEYSPEQVCYHYNYFDAKTRRFRDKPFSNGWAPIVLIDEDVAGDGRFCDETDKLKGHSVEYVRVGTVEILTRLKLPFETIPTI